MKYIKLFEDYKVKVNEDYKNFDSTYVIDAKYNDQEKIFIAYCDDIKDMSPLHYVWSEYPTYKEMKGGFLQYSYEFYTDDKGNKYFIYGSCERKDFNLDEFVKKIKEHGWNMSRNVDRFVNGADKGDYKKWKEDIS